MDYNIFSIIKKLKLLNKKAGAYYGVILILLAIVIKYYSFPFVIIKCSVSIISFNLLIPLIIDIYSKKEKSFTKTFYILGITLIFIIINFAIWLK